MENGKLYFSARYPYGYKKCLVTEQANFATKQNRLKHQSELEQQLELELEQLYHNISSSFGHARTAIVTGGGSSFATKAFAIAIAKTGGRIISAIGTTNLAGRRSTRRSARYVANGQRVSAGAIVAMRAFKHCTHIGHRDAAIEIDKSGLLSVVHSTLAWPRRSGHVRGGARGGLRVANREP